MNMSMKMMYDDNSGHKRLSFSLL